MAKGADYMELRYIQSFKSQVKRCDHSLWGPLCCAVLVTQSCPTLRPHPWTAALQAPLSMGIL